MCGVATTRGNVASAQSVGGSFWNTSSPAPPTWPLCSAASSAASSISSPRAVLMMRTPFLHLLNRSALNSRLVCSVLGRCSEM